MEKLKLVHSVCRSQMPVLSQALTGATKNKACFLSLRPQRLWGWRDDKCDQQMAPFLVMAPSGLIRVPASLLFLLQMILRAYC